MSGWVNVTGLPDIIDALVLSFAQYSDSHSVLLDSTISIGNRYIRGLRCRCRGSVIVEFKCRACPFMVRPIFGDLRLSEVNILAQLTFETFSVFDCTLGVLIRQSLTNVTTVLEAPMTLPSPSFSNSFHAS